VGDRFQHVVDVEATAAEAPALAAGLTRWLVELGVIELAPAERALGGPGHPPGPEAARATGGAGAPASLHTNGVAVVSTRTVFDGGPDDGSARCPRCAEDVGWDVLGPAVDEWWAGGEGVRPCPGCGAPGPLNGWRWEPAWAFGCLGLTFWNWPPLSADFVREIGERLGHRCVSVHGGR
jgi:hypothetical protein